MAMTATILQADLDAFCASVEQLDPSLRGRPIGRRGRRAMGELELSSWISYMTIYMVRSIT